jgi:hypothetical protein
MLTFTGVLAAAAIVQVIVMIVQSRYMRNALEVTRLAADAAKQSADAASEAVANSRATERAIVLIDTVEATMITPAHGVDSASVIIFTLKNFGRTIANTVEFTGTLTGVGQLPLEELPPTTIAPQGTNSWITKRLGEWVNEATIQLINAKGLLVEYKITVTYSDTFDRYKYHCEGRYEPSLKRFLITANKTD